MAKAPLQTLTVISTGTVEPLGYHGEPGLLVPVPKKQDPNALAILIEARTGFFAGHVHPADDVGVSYLVIPTTPARTLAKKFDLSRITCFREMKNLLEVGFKQPELAKAKQPQFPSDRADRIMVERYNPGEW